MQQHRATDHQLLTSVRDKEERKGRKETSKNRDQEKRDDKMTRGRLRK